ncbi:MAG: hypothetical protein NZ522_03650, partial [Chitinophagales bacterium]|nr:hypothetical protein [Chitinophagales bacterium]
RKGNSEKHEATIQGGVLGAEAALEGPISRKHNSSYLINYRYSTLQLFALTGLKIGGDITPRYQDLSFNLSFPAKKYGMFTLFGLGGISSLGTKVKEDTLQWQSLQDKTASRQSYRMATTGITHLIFPDNQTYIKTTLAFSYASNLSQADTFSATLRPFNISSETYDYYYSRMAVTANRKIDSRNLVRCGAYLTFTYYSLNNQQYNFFNRRTETLARAKGLTQLVQSYWQWKYRFSEALSITTGLHFTYFMLNKRAALEPRANIEWKPLSNHSLSLAVGLHNRTDAVSAYISKIENSFGLISQANLSLDMTRAAHAVLGYDFIFLKDFRLHAETYFQYLYNIPSGTDDKAWFAVVNENDGFVNFPLINKGRGMNYGLELTLEKSLSKNYFFLVTASLFESRYAGTDLVWRNTAFNGNYVLNILGSKEFFLGKQKMQLIGFTAKALFRGGMRITPLDLEASRANGRAVYDYSRAFSEKLPDYFRLDFGAYFRKNNKRWSWILSFDAQNIIDRRNVAFKIYDAQKQEVKIIRNLGIIPVISWKAEFGFGKKE